MAIAGIGIQKGRADKKSGPEAAFTLRMADMELPTKPSIAQLFALCKLHDVDPFCV